VVTGTINLAVTNVTAFLADPAARTKVATGIAKSLGVPSTYVSVTLSAARRLDSMARRLSGSSNSSSTGGVNVAYTITIPAAAPSYVPSTTAITAALGATATLATSISAATGQTVTVTVPAGGEPVSRVVTTTPAAGPSKAAASDAQSYNAGPAIAAIFLCMAMMKV